MSRKINDGLTNQQRYRLRHPDRVRAVEKRRVRRRKASDEQRLAHNEGRRKWRAANKDKVRRINLKVFYNITPEQWDEMFALQGGVCALCQLPKPLHVDHSHVSNKIRGLLCIPCNVSLGQMGDEPEPLERALAYVRGELVKHSLPADLVAGRRYRSQSRARPNGWKKPECVGMG